MLLTIDHSPSQKDWPIWVGNDEDFFVTVYHGVTGERVDLSMVGIRAWVKAGTTLDLQFTNASGVTVLDQTDPATRGQFYFGLTRDQTRDLPTVGQPEKAKYEIEFTIDGKETSFLYGFVLAQEWVNTDAAAPVAP